MNNHFYTFLLRVFLLFLSGVCSANADGAVCTVNMPKVTYSFDFGNIVVPPNAKVGDVLAQQYQGSSYDTEIICSPGTGTIYNTMVAPWMTTTNINAVYATNIPGVGIRIVTTGGFPYSSDGGARQYYQYPGLYLHAYVGGAYFYIIKTGDITNGGTLNTGLAGQTLDELRNSAVDVILGNATISLPACNFNNGNPIDVDFGSAVAVTDVAAGTVEKPIDYTLTCNYDNFGLKLKILGTGASFDNDLLKTNINEMGIKITANGTALPLNTDLNFASAAAKPALKAILTQQPGARLPTGAFNASATMRVEYQ